MAKTVGLKIELLVRKNDRTKHIALVGYEDDDEVFRIVFDEEEALQVTSQIIDAFSPSNFSKLFPSYRIN